MHEADCFMTTQVRCFGILIAQIWMNDIMGIHRAKDRERRNDHKRIILQGLCQKIEILSFQLSGMLCQVILICLQNLSRLEGSNFISTNEVLSERPLSPANDFLRILITMVPLFLPRTGEEFFFLKY